MHDAVRTWVAVHRLPPPRTVVDIGGRNINGGVRDLFPGAQFTSVDLHPGPDVDVVGDFLDYTPPEPVDLVLCLEVAEHCPVWDRLLEHAAEILRPGGRLIFTAAGPGRSPHSGLDEQPIRPDEHYANVDPSALTDVLGQRFSRFTVDLVGLDVRAVATR